MATILAFGLAWLGQAMGQTYSIYLEAIGLLPLIWLTLRHGWASGIIGGALTGFFLGLFNYGLDQLAVLVVLGMIPFLMVGLAGIFSKYSQKTLNNKRYSSTYLNIGTASFLVSLTFTLLRTHILPKVVEAPVVFELTDLNLWFSILAFSLVFGLVLALFSRLKPAFLIPKRSKYLSRRETSSLLND